MDNVSFIESEMTFGEYDKDSFFRIEKCIQYTEKLKNSGVKICEFLLLKGNKLIFVEAKKSCPNSKNAEICESARIRYDKYIDDVVQKMRNSLSLYSGILLKRYTMQGMPINLCTNDISGLDIVFLLIVKNADDGWLVPMRDDLSKRMRAEMNIWKIKHFFVINEVKAREKGWVM